MVMLKLWGGGKALERLWGNLGEGFGPWGRPCGSRKGPGEALGRHMEGLKNLLGREMPWGGLVSDINAADEFDPLGSGESEHGSDEF